MADPGLTDHVDVEDDGNITILYLGEDDPRWLVLEPPEANTTVKPFTTTLVYNSRVDIYDLNREKAASFFPVFIALGCIVVLGVLSNILVCYIYRCRSRRATSNFFVIFFAIFDMFGIFIGIPLEISNLALPYTHDVGPLCKVMGFVESLSVCGQCLTLICVAYDCHRKLCRPSAYFNVKKAQFSCLVSLIVAGLLSIPAGFVFNTRKVETSYPGVYGDTCTVDPAQPQWLRLLYYICILGTFTLCLVLMTIFYCLIGVNWCTQKQAEARGEKVSPVKKEFPKKHRFVREDTSSSSVTNYSEEICRLHNSTQSDPARVPLKSGSCNAMLGSAQSDPARVPLKTTVTGIVKTNSLQATSSPPGLAVVQLHVKNSKQASIFMAVSFIFVAVLLPFVVVMILCASTPVFTKFSSNTMEIIFNLCIRSYLLNYIVKPIVYIIFNIKFRKEVKHLLDKLWAFCSHAGSPPTEQNAAPRQLRRTFTVGATRSTSKTPIYKPPRAST